MDICIREHMIYGDFLRENTLTIDNSIMLLDEEFNSFNKIVEATNILINESILNEGSTLNILKSFLEKVINIIKKIKDFIVRFIKEKIIDPFLSMKDKLLNKIKKTKTEDITEEKVKELENTINAFKEKDIKIKEDLLETLKEKISTINKDVEVESESVSLLKETNNLSNCVFIELVNKDAIKYVSNLFDEFLNIIEQKYDPTLFNKLIDKINNAIDIGSLVFSFKEKMIGIDDWVEPRIYDQIFEFVKSNYDISNQIAKKLSNLESIYKNDLNNLKADQNDLDLNKAMNRQRLELSIKIINVLNKIVIGNLRYLDILRATVKNCIEIVSYGV